MPKTTGSRDCCERGGRAGTLSWIHVHSFAGTISSCVRFISLDLIIKIFNLRFTVRAYSSFAVYQRGKVITNQEATLKDAQGHGVKGSL